MIPESMIMNNKKGVSHLVINQQGRRPLRKLHIIWRRGCNHEVAARQ